MNGKYVGNRPIKLRKSKWRDRQKKVKNFTIKEWFFSHNTFFHSLMFLIECLVFNSFYCKIISQF